MSQQSGGEHSGATAGRAGVALRVWGCCLGLFSLGVGGVSLFGLPEDCRLIGYLAAGLFVPVGVWAVFVSLRGRRSDLQGLAGREAADAAASGAAGRALGEVVDKLT